MLSIPSARLTAPVATAGEILRKDLIDTVLNSPAKIVYIHAGAGHGKTTLLSQVANSVENAVWLSLDGEDDIFTFVNLLCEAVKRSLPEFDFLAEEYLPFSEKDNFISFLAGAFICSLENISSDLFLVMDDLHTIENNRIKNLLPALSSIHLKMPRFFLEAGRLSGRAF